MKEPVDHILRPSLPWRQSSGMTECGLNANSVRMLSRDEYFSRFKEFGQQRTALLTCMTCGDTCRRWVTWDEDPRKALAREIQWEVGWARTDRGALLRDELLVIASLISEHHQEFAERLNEIGRRRDWLEKKAANAASRSKINPYKPRLL